MRKVLTLVASVMLAAGAALFAAPAGAQSGDASVVVIHGVPDTPVDVYVNGKATLTNFAPDTVTDPLSLPAGDYTIDVRAAGAAATAAPVITGKVTLPAGANATLVAHLDASGKPVLTPFVNDPTAPPAGQGCVIVRHTAAAPAVDVYAGDQKVITALTNPKSSEQLNVPAGTISAKVTASGSTDAAIGPADVPVTDGMCTVVYAVGSLQDGNLHVLTQTLDTGAMAMPGGVNTGNSGLAASDSGPSTALLVGIAAVALAAAGTASLTLARRRG